MNSRAQACIAAACGTTVAAHADESMYRCTGSIARIGDLRFTVRETCGEPNDIATLSVGGADVAEEAHAYGGETSIPYVPHPRGGKLIAIEPRTH